MRPKAKFPRGLLALVLIVVVGLVPLLIWWFSPGSSHHVLLLDKTVPHPDYREHASAIWVLNHVKARPPAGGDEWKKHRDYIGYYPRELDEAGFARRSDLTNRHLEGKDILFITDTYGVHTGDFTEQSSKRASSGTDTLVYGGLSSQEVTFIDEFVDSGKSLIAEFNTFASPTAGPTRTRLERRLGLRWTGWSGRFFSELGDESEVPGWARRDWLRQYEEPWIFTGPGYLFCHEDSRLLVLEEWLHLENEDLTVHVTTRDPLLEGVARKSVFHFWFDIVSPRASTEVLAEYHLSLTKEGRDLMTKFGIPEKFPAVLRASKSPLILYLAGDFSDARIYRGPYFLSGWPGFQGLRIPWVTRYDHFDFFWNFYVPLLKNILLDD